MSIWRKQSFVNEKGQEIVESTPVDEAAMPVNPSSSPDLDVKPAIPRFHSVGILQLQMPDGRMMQQQFHFAVPGDTLGEAFENLPVAMAEASQRVQADVARQQQQQAHQIVLPGGGSISSITGRPRTRIAR